MLRVGTCNHCGECCGGARPDGKHILPWKIGRPTYSITSWSQENIDNHPLYSRVSHPSLTGFRSGTINIDGEEFEYAWIPELGLVKSEDNIQCPFLKPYIDENTGRCGIYGTSAHDIWETVCSTYPGLRLSLDNVILHGLEMPSCSHEYVEE